MNIIIGTLLWLGVVQPITGCLDVPTGIDWHNQYGIDIWDSNEQNFRWNEDDILIGSFAPVGDGWMVIVLDKWGHRYALPTLVIEADEFGHVHFCGAYKVVN